MATETHRNTRKDTDGLVAFTAPREARAPNDIPCISVCFRGYPVSSLLTPDF